MLRRNGGTLAIGFILGALTAWGIGWADEPAGKAGNKRDGRLITLDVTDAPIEDILRLLSQQTGINILLDLDKSAVKTGTVTAVFKEKPLEVVLKYICGAVGLDCRLVGDAYIVTPTSQKPANKSSEPDSADALRKHIDALKIELTRAKVQCDDNHPRVLQMQAELDTLLYRLAQTEGWNEAMLPDVTAAFANLAKAEEALKVAEAEMQQRQASLTAAEAELKAVEENLRELKEKYKAGAAAQTEARQAETAVAKAEVNLDKFFARCFDLPGVGLVSESQLLVPAEPLRKRVSLSEKNAKLEDILRKLSQQAGIPMTIHESVSQDIQVTNATLYGVTLADALHLLLQQAGLRAVPSEDRKGIVIVPPNRVEIKGSASYGQPSAIYSLGAASVTNPLSDLVAPYRQYGPSGVTILRDSPAVSSMLRTYPAAVSAVTVCSKCKMPLQPDWLYCPKCGAKNEQSKGKDWKFCPTCGRAVSTTGSASGVTTGKKK